MRQIVQDPDPVLRQLTDEVPREKIRSGAYKDLVTEMVEAMRAHGVGLAAPQIGESIRLIVAEDTEALIKRADLTPAQVQERKRTAFSLQVLFNPVLRPIGAASGIFFEGCLSVKNAKLTGLVERYLDVEVTALDEFGELKTWKASGWPARIVQHEIDHLDRILFTDPCRLIPNSLMEFEEASTRFKGKLIPEVIAELGAEVARFGREGLGQPSRFGGA